MERTQYRRELALALFPLHVLHVLRTLLAGAVLLLWLTVTMASGRCMPTWARMVEFAVLAYRAVTGLRAATQKFLADPAVMDAEQQLPECWQACQAKGRDDFAGQGTRLLPWYETASDLADAVPR
jgi:hypothetical protein